MMVFRVDRIVVVLIGAMQHSGIPSEFRQDGLGKGVGILLGWGPVAFAIGLIGLVILMRASLRRNPMSVALLVLVMSAEDKGNSIAVM
jgi:hypothetical protein